MGKKTFSENIFHNIQKLQKQKPDEAFLKKMESYAQAHAGLINLGKVNTVSLAGLAASLLLLCLLNGYAVGSTNSANLTIEESESYHLLATQFLYDE